nr:uncharacterized protein LOC127315005 [Lolium perenne]
MVLASTSISVIDASSPFVLELLQALNSILVSSRDHCAATRGRTHPNRPLCNGHPHSRPCRSTEARLALVGGAGRREAGVDQGPASSSSRTRLLLVTSSEEALAVDAADELESPSDEWSSGSSSSSMNERCTCTLAWALAQSLASILAAAASSAASSASSRVHLASESSTSSSSPSSATASPSSWPSSGDGLHLLLVVPDDGLRLLLLAVRRQGARAARRGSSIPPMPPSRWLPLAVHVRR